MQGGEEPDPRFTLANERTYLAWTRTALAFLAGGTALEAFPINGLAESFRTGLAVFVIGSGLLIALGAGVRWIRVERAMRHHKPLPLPGIFPFLSAVSVITCLLAMWAILR